jgi:hypothetical protein
MTPTPTQFLLPVLTLVAWTLVMWVWLYAMRLPAMRRAHINPQEAAYVNLAERLPHRARWAADNYNHLHEQPTTFYALMLAIAVMGAADPGGLTLAWGYVACRILHSLIQATVNVVVWRFAVFTVGTLLLAVLTVRTLAHALA